MLSVGSDDLSPGSPIECGLVFEAFTVCITRARVLEAGFCECRSLTRLLFSSEVVESVARDVVRKTLRGIGRKCKLIGLPKLGL